MSIYTVDSNLPTTTKIETINDMVKELEGYVDQGRFNKNEITQIIADVGLDRKYLRDQGIGNTVSTYTGWSHVHAESGYSIWKYSPTSYKYNSLNKLYFNNMVLENRGEASAETATTFDYVYEYDPNVASGVSAYTNYTAESATEEGTGFTVLSTTSLYLYMGSASKFSGSKFEFHTRGSNYTLKVEYWNGAWTTMTAAANNLDDDTSSFQGDGKISWTSPSDWVEATVNTYTKYWIRISTTTTPVTAAKIYYLIPYTSVIGLLALSSTQIQEEDWAWCSYGTAIYVTVRNTGVTNYEGSYYITSASSSTNKENFFVHNNEFTGDYEDSTYVSSPQFATGAIGFTFGDATNPVSTGLACYFTVPYTCTLQAWYLFAADEGAITLDIWKDTYANFPPTVADTIVSGSAAVKPMIDSSASKKDKDETLSGWDTAITAGDVLAINVDSVSGVSQVTLVLKVLKTN